MYTLNVSFKFSMIGKKPKFLYLGKSKTVKMETCNLLDYLKLHVFSFSLVPFTFLDIQCISKEIRPKFSPFMYSTF